MELKITIDQLENLLMEQKRIVVEKLLDRTGYYNTESDSGNYRTLPIDKEKFLEVGMSARLPDDINILKRYIK
jgi:hypothetical protein